MRDFHVDAGSDADSRDTVPSEADAAAVRDWVAEWGEQVAAVDMAAARDRFAPDVVAFGTYAELVHGIDELHDHQWSNVWPSIDGFAFRLDDLVVLAADDGSQFVAVVPWDSTGVDKRGNRFPRPGRATIVLRRQPDGSLVGVHTHFSLAPRPDHT